MDISRENMRQAFDHVLDNVIGKDNGSGLKSALIEAGFNDLLLLLNLTVEDINDLEYANTAYDSSNTSSPMKLPVLKADRGLLLAFLAYDEYLNTIDNNQTDYMTISKSDFDQFRISKEYKPTVNSTFKDNNVYDINQEQNTNNIDKRRRSKSNAKCKSQKHNMTNKGRIPLPYHPINIISLDKDEPNGIHDDTSEEEVILFEPKQDASFTSFYDNCFDLNTDKCFLLDNFSIEVIKYNMIGISNKVVYDANHQEYNVIKDITHDKNDIDIIHKIDSSLTTNNNDDMNYKMIKLLSWMVISYPTYINLTIDKTSRSNIHEVTNDKGYDWVSTNKIDSKCHINAVNMSIKHKFTIDVAKKEYCNVCSVNQLIDIKDIINCSTLNKIKYISNLYDHWMNKTGLEAYWLFDIFKTQQDYFTKHVKFKSHYLSNIGKQLKLYFSVEKRCEHESILLNDICVIIFARVCRTNIISFNVIVQLWQINYISICLQNICRSKIKNGNNVKIKGNPVYFLDNTNDILKLMKLVNHISRILFKTESIDGESSIYVLNDIYDGKILRNNLQYNVKRYIVSYFDISGYDICADLLGGEIISGNTFQHNKNTRNRSNQNSTTFRIDELFSISISVYKSLLTSENTFGQMDLIIKSSIGEQIKVQVIKARDVKSLNKIQNYSFVSNKYGRCNEEATSYNVLFDPLYEERWKYLAWKIYHIFNHQDLPTQNSFRYRGSTINDVIERDNGEQKCEPLPSNIFKDPAIRDIHGRDNGEPYKPGWKKSKKNQKQIIALITQPKMKSLINSTTFVYAYSMNSMYDKLLSLNKRYMISSQHATDLGIDQPLKCAI